MKRKILMVDDEVSVLNSLKRCLRTEPYEILTAQSGAEAIELLHEHQVSLIITDINMPVMDGIDLICSANAISPYSVKMVLSAYADLELVMDAINRGHVWRYLVKPWQPEDIRMTIANAVDYYDVQVERRKLVHILEVKNQELEEWAQTLEQKVGRRTSHIQSELVLMRMLLNGSELSLFCKAIIPYFADHFKSDNVSIYSKIDNISYYKDSHGKQTSEDTLVQVRQAMQHTDVYMDDQLIIAPVVNCGTVYGAVVIRDYGISYEDVCSEYESYLALTTIALTQNAMKKQLPQMLKNIDEMIRELE